MISVIVPIYNVEKYLGRCLDSILAQTYIDYEILCVNDCGKDGSMEIARQYAMQHPDKIHIIESDRNVGLGGARDKGIREASGDYLMFVDSDDTITSDYLESYLDAAVKSQADIVAGGYRRILAGENRSYPGNPEDPWYCWVNISAWAKLFKSDFLRKNSLDFRSIRTYEDAPFIYRCLAKGPRIAVIPHDGYWYYQNPESITTLRNRDRTLLYEQYAGDLADMYEELDFKKEEQEILTYSLASQLVTNLLFNGQHAGIKRMRELYRNCNCFLKKLDPLLQNNRFISKTIPVSEPDLNRTATWIVLSLRKIRLDAPVFMAVSLLPKVR